MIKKLIVLSSLSLYAALAVGCGQSGPLYLPEKEAPSSEKSASESDKSGS